MFYFWFYKIFNNNKLSNIQYLLSCRFKHYITTLVHLDSWIAFLTIPRAWGKVLSFGRSQQDKKTNKQPSLIDKFLATYFYHIWNLKFESTIYFLFQTLSFKAKSVAQLNQVIHAKLWLGWQCIFWDSFQCKNLNLIVWNMLLAQVWTRLCNYFKCDRTSNDRSQLWKKKLKLNDDDKNDSKFNISSLGFKIWNHLQKSYSSTTFQEYQ
jgi:hypothetical protein